MSGTVIRYSESFKLQVVDELERGRFSSPNDASRAYGITGKGTVQRWVKEYGKNHLLRKVVKVQKQGEPGEIRVLKDRVKKLEHALADAHMDEALERAAFELLCEEMHVDPHAFKKKVAGSASARPANKPGIDKE